MNKERLTLAQRRAVWLCSIAEIDPVLYATFGVPVPAYPLGMKYETRIIPPFGDPLVTEEYMPFYKMEQQQNDMDT